ncbi:MAG: hypothetical protein WCQ26_10085 [Pseudanabaena sp. ELA748]
MPDPTTAQLSDFEIERRLLHRLAAHTRDEDPQVHVFAVLKFIAIDLLAFGSPSAIKGGESNGK